MSEAVYNKVQLGRESTLGTGVAATTIFPVDAGFLGFELDRASESPDEDFGTSDREQAGRESTGVRGATASMPFVCRFQDIFHLFEMHVAGSVAPTGVGPYVYTYTFDSTADTLKGYTVEYGDINSTQDEWEAVGVVANELELSFDALSSPGNAMWKGSAGLMAWNRSQAAMTAALAAPTTLETMEGHLTTLAEGSTATAFGSLSALTASLKSFSMSSTLNVAERAYGGTTDVPTGRGRSGKGEITFESMLKISATTLTNMHDIFNVSGGLPTERRWRLTIDGSGNNAMTIDARVRYRAVDLGDHEGERLYLVKGVFVRDSTLAGRAQVILTNDVASVP
jgi:hypothetical protein